METTANTADQLKRQCDEKPPKKKAAKPKGDIMKQLGGRR